MLLCIYSQHREANYVTCKAMGEAPWQGEGADYDLGDFDLCQSSVKGNVGVWSGQTSSLTKFSR
jgi:hypothetical protein